MAYIEIEDVINASGERGMVRHEAPPGPNGEPAIAYLRPSGDSYPNPIHRDPITKQPLVEYVSDQRWLYDPTDAAKAQKAYPDRYVPTKA